MNILKHLLKRFLKRLLQQFEDKLDIFILREGTLLSLKEELSPEIGEQLCLLSHQHYVTGSFLASELTRILGNNDPIKAKIFQKTIDPQRLFDIELRDQKKTIDGPIRSIVKVVCKHYHVRNEDIDDWVQQVYTRLTENDFQKICRFQGNSSFLTYLMVVIERICIDEARNRWGRTESRTRDHMEEPDQYYEHKRPLDNSLIHGQASSEDSFDHEIFWNTIKPNQLTEKVATPEDLAIIRDTVAQFRQQVYQAKALKLFQLTKSSLETIKLQSGDADVANKLKKLLYQEYERENGFVEALHNTIGKSETERWATLILENSFCIPEKYKLFLKRVEEGHSILHIAEELEMTPGSLYARVRKLKTEMQAKGWDTNLVEYFFER
ncbi:MAG: sigma-70 family RNA polymerase sigma factor [SAR324 cluster bacterium]|nr:sigma-70 family RNA polymerase sigma factor [SAR324 cluster bacterium]